MAHKNGKSLEQRQYSMEVLYANNMRFPHAGGSASFYNSWKADAELNMT